MRKAFDRDVWRGNRRPPLITPTAVALAAFLAVGSGAEAADPTAGRTPTAQSVSTISGLRVNVSVKYERGGTTAVLSPGDVLTSDDNYRVIFTPTHDGYVYVYQIDAAHRVDTIFPNPKYTAASNPVTSTIVYSVPPEGRWLHLDDRRGAEDIIVVAADKALADPRAIAVRTARGAAAAGEPVGTPATEHVFAYRLTFEHR
jgi:hypothetical protein